VELVTDAIREVRAHAIVAADGTEREVDTIILGTGFRATDPPIAHRIRGRGGRTLGEAWAERGIEAYRGTTVSGFPNLFVLVGPNTGLGHTSIVFMIESQITYVLDALRTMEEWGVTSFDVLPEAQAAYNDRIHRELDGTVWNSGCASWYLDEKGRNSTLWPTFTWRYRQETRRFDAGAYHLYAAQRIPVAR
jgi:cation diffusion facilitator CzcD-associated flavoprotein CzcO